MGLNKRLIDQAGAGGVTSTDNFDIVTYTGNGSTQSISSLDFQPDTIWIKHRQSTYDHFLYDSIRGGSKHLVPNSTQNERSETGLTISFNSNGFTLANDNAINQNNNNFVAWCFKGGGSAVSGTSSQATNVTMSPNPDAGFSIVKFTSSSSTASPPPMNYISHGLNAAPEMVIYKNLISAQDWRVQNKDLNQSTCLLLNSTSAVGSPAAYTFFDNTSTNIGVRSNYAISRGETYIAYCFHSVDFYQKVGSYTGTGASGNAITGLGFEPRFLMMKATNANEDWVILDAARNTSDPRNTYIMANLSYAEFSNTSFNVNFDTDGFTINGNAVHINGSGTNYIYLAIA